MTKSIKYQTMGRAQTKAESAHEKMQGAGIHGGSEEDVLHSFINTQLTAFPVLIQLVLVCAFFTLLFQSRNLSV